MFCSLVERPFEIHHPTALCSGMENGVPITHSRILADVVKTEEMTWLKPFKRQMTEQKPIQVSVHCITLRDPMCFVKFQGFPEVEG